MHARFVRLEWHDTAQRIAHIYFAPDKPLYFTAGQYIDLTVPHANPDRRGVTRTMTISSSPSSKQFCITTRFAAGSESTYKQALRSMRAGEAVSITDAMGDLVLPLDDTVPLVFVAGGLGIASYASMLRWLAEKHDRRDVIVLYAVRDVRDILFADLLVEYGKIGKITCVLYTTDNKTPVNWPGSIQSSRLASDAVVTYLRPNSQIYLSGTEKMVEQLYDELTGQLHIEQYRIAHDYFSGYTEL